MIFDEKKFDSFICELAETRNINWSEASRIRENLKTGNLSFLAEEPVNVEYNRKAEVVPYIVAKWLDREEFNSAGFDRIINDAFSNNGHHYIDDPEVRAWIKDNSAALKNALDNGHEVSHE